MYRESSFTVMSTSIVLSDPSFWYSQQTYRHSSLLYLALFLYNFIVEWSHIGLKQTSFLNSTPLNSPLSLFFPHPTSNSSRNFVGSTLKSYLGSNCFLPPPLICKVSAISVSYLNYFSTSLPPLKVSLFSHHAPLQSYSQYNSQSDPFKACSHLPAQTLVVTPYITQCKS